MGVVWLGTDTRLHRTVALKLGKPGARISDEGIGGAQADASECDRRVRRDGGPHRPGVAGHGVSVVPEPARGPANVLVTPDRTAKLTDFGIATWESETRTEDPRTDGGTWGFQAPEMVRGNRATTASDVYSLGATLLTAVEGDLSPEAAPNAPLRTALAGLVDNDPDRRPTAEQVQRQLTDLGWTRSRRGWWIVAAAPLWCSRWSCGGSTRSVPPGQPRRHRPASPRQVLRPCPHTVAHGRPAHRRSVRTDFNRCDALVYLTKNHQDFVDVKVAFDIGQQDPTAPIQRDGVIGIERPPAQTGDCTRILLLPDNYQVITDANETDHETVDLCGMAETITNSALIALGGGQIARRALPPESLADKNACAILDNHTVTSIVGPGPIALEPSFADWRCDWDYTTGPILVEVIFDRTPAEDLGGPVIRIGRYSAVVQAQGYSDTDCLVSLVYRGYVDQTGVQTDEMVPVDLDDKTKPPQQLCAPAQRLATSVAQRLSG